MTIFLIHSLLLVAVSFAAARRLCLDLSDRLIAAGVLAWGNLVATSLLLSCVHELGAPAWFFRTSVLLAALTWLVCHRSVPEPAAAAPGGTLPQDCFDRRLLLAFVLTLAPIAYASLRIAGTYEPNNYDSLTYHLPRAMFYLGQNSLAHFDTGNPRQIYFPFDYNLLQLFGLIYSPPLQVLNFVNLVLWGISGLAVYRIGRLSTLSANTALLAAWLALTSTQVLAQATATTNDLPTAAGLLCALVFALRWRHSRRRRDALISGLAAGLTAGAKLTVLFFGPAAALILLTLGWQHWRRGEIRAYFAGLRAWLIPGLFAFAFASPFALINLAEKGQWINHDYDFTLNRPFALGCVAQTSAAYLTQLFLEPLHRFAFDLNFTAELNAWGQRTLFPHWNAAYAFSPLYLFPPDLNEDHVWFGFAGPFIFLCALFCLFRFRKFQPPLVWLAALGVGWFATYFVLNKWSLYNQRYFVPVILVMSPCIGGLVETIWARPALRRTTQYVLALLALSSVWLAGVYLFENTSRPFGPLWGGMPPPPALPALPPTMAARLSKQPRINIDSTDGNERIFLLMTLGQHQRFTAFARVQPDSYNVFSEWGFVRKVAYSNIEQLSSYTIVNLPAKRTAGVEFLGTIGSGQPALDYYGLAPHPERVAPSAENRNVMVTLYYGPHGPDRYTHLRLKVAGLNAPDHARLTVGVEYENGSTASLGTFTRTGEGQASVTRPFRRFTIRVNDEASGRQLGAIDIPYQFRDQPPEVEAPENPASVFADELVSPAPKASIRSEGLAAPEGPYPQWDLPLIRWAKSPMVRLLVPANPQLGRMDLSFSLRLQARDSASIDVLLNGNLVKSFQVSGRTTWLTQTLQLVPTAGQNVIEFRNVEVGTEPDWLDYLERYPDVKAYVLSQKIPLEQGARDHWESNGKHETRTLNLKRQTVTLPSADQLYYVFRNLKIEGFRKP